MGRCSRLSGRSSRGGRRALGRSLRAEGYGQAIVLPNSFKSALVPFFARIPRRTGWRGEMRFGLLNDLRLLPEASLPLMAQRFVALGLKPGAAPPADVPFPRLAVDPASAALCRREFGLERARPLLEIKPKLTRLCREAGVDVAFLVSVNGATWVEVPRPGAPYPARAMAWDGSLVLAIGRRELTLPRLREVMQSTLRISSMVFLILIGASVFSLVFRGYGGDDAVRAILESLPGGVVGAVIVVMLVMFLLGFVLDFIEITFVVVPIVGPVLLAMGLDPVWLGIMIAINLQTSFLTPPVGFAIFYLKGVCPAGVKLTDIYRGVVPFIVLQLIGLGLVFAFSALVTWLPGIFFGV